MSNVSKHFCFLSQQGGPREGQLLPPHTCFGLPPGCLGDPPMMMGSQIHQQVFTNHPSGCVSNDVVPIGELETSALHPAMTTEPLPPCIQAHFPQRPTGFPIVILPKSPWTKKNKWKNKGLFSFKLLITTL